MRRFYEPILTGSQQILLSRGMGTHSPPGPHILLSSWLKGLDPNFTINVVEGHPGALATVSYFTLFSDGEN